MYTAALFADGVYREYITHIIRVTFSYNWKHNKAIRQTCSDTLCVAPPTPNLAASCYDLADPTRAEKRRQAERQEAEEEDDAREDHVSADLVLPAPRHSLGAQHVLSNDSSHMTSAAERCSNQINDVAMF